MSDNLKNYVCTTCGDQLEAEYLPIEWSRAKSSGREQFTCARCSRGFIRDIEGKLDPGGEY